MKLGSLIVMVLLAGCSDDECSMSPLEVEVTPAQSCLQLSAIATSGAYQIVGTNNCTEPLVVHYAGTHDGGANETFDPGAQISIPLSEGEVFNQPSATKTWTRNAVLGNETITITMTTTPC